MPPSILARKEADEDEGEGDDDGERPFLDDILSGSLTDMGRELEEHMI